MPRFRGRLRYVLASAAMALIGAIAVADLVSHGRNTLARKPYLLSLKTHAMGAASFVLTRNALANDRLNLTAWHGGEEVVFREPVSPTRIAGRFRIESYSWIVIEWDRDENGSSGFRFSRSEGYPSQGFDADPRGAFVARFDGGDTKVSDGWHEFRIDLRDQVQVTLDDQPVTRWERTHHGPGRVGLRAGLRGEVLVDDVVITDDRGQSTVETFDNRREFWPGLGVAAAALVIGGIGATLAARNPLRPLAAAVPLTLLLVATAVFDRAYWSERYPYSRGSGLPEPPSSPAMSRVRALGRVVESARAKLLDSYPLPLDVSSKTLTPLDAAAEPEGYLRLGLTNDWNRTEEIRSRLQELRPAVGAFRVIFVGTSQTAGAGASSRAEGLVPQTHLRLRRRFPELNIETLNLAASGSNSTVLTAAIEPELSRLSPQLVVINLANNDANPTKLAQNLSRLLAAARTAGASVALTLEANFEGASETLRANHPALMALGRETNVPVLDLHGFLSSPAIHDSGFLAWDYVHPTSLGHELAADFFAAQLEPLIRAHAASTHAPAGASR